MDTDYVECKKCGYVAHMFDFLDDEDQSCPKCHSENWEYVDSDYFDKEKMNEIYEDKTG